jgi:membrane protease YdiL (CAAX protease family)
MTNYPAGVQQTTYVAGKILQFGFPLLWVFAIRREGIHIARPRTAGLLQGLLFGAGVFAAMVAGYYLWLKPGGYLAAAVEPITQKVAGFGVAGPGGFIALGVFYCLIHSLLEEYYWRWFLMGRLARLMPAGLAVLLSSVAFAAHHVIVLGVYFGGGSWATVVFSLGVAIGGAAWAWIYRRSGSLLGPWLSHLLVDAAIFVIGYDLVRWQ